MINIVGLMVVFGLTWLFGALTVREVSTVFQYLFVIFNGFQGFFFFVVVCLIGKDGRKFWTHVITCSLCRKSKKFSTMGTSNLREKACLTYHSPMYTAKQLLAGSKSEELKFNSQLQEKTEIKMDTIIPNQKTTSSKICIKDSPPETLGLEESGTGMKSEIDMESQLDIERNVVMANEDEANLMQGEVNGNMKTNVTYSNMNGDIVMMNRDIQASFMQDRVNERDTGTDPANVMGDGTTQYDTIASFVQNQVNVFEQKLKEFEELQFAPLGEKGNENSIG